MEPDEELEIRPVPVVIHGEERSRSDLAPIGVSFNRVSAASDGAIRLLGRDPHRGRTEIISISQPIYVGSTKNEVDAGTAAVWPDANRLSIPHTDEVWVMCAAGAGTSTTISVMSGLWK